MSQIRGYIAGSIVSVAALLVLGSCDGAGLWGPSCPQPRIVFIDSHEVWAPDGGPIVLDCDVYVTPRGILEIRAGTRIELVPDSVCVPDPAGNLSREPRFEVDGQLLCLGTPHNMIEFVCDDPSGSWYSRSMRIQGDKSVVGDSIIRWADVGFVHWLRGSATVSHSTVTMIDLYECSEISVDSCTIWSLGVFRGGPGALRANVFTGGASTFSDSLLIIGNVFSNPTGKGLGSHHDSRSCITENSFAGCETGLLIFSGSPELHMNNFSGNQRNIVVLPELENVESDTIDARSNWWGTVDSLEVAAGIHYEQNGDFYSEKVILYQPYALEPFDLSSSGCASSGLHPN